MKFEIDVDAYNGVGPYTDLYGHGPVTVIQQYDDEGEHDDALFVCLDCGYTNHDNRMFQHRECDRGTNPINQTWREAIDHPLDR